MYEKDSLGWRLQQLQRQLGEWWELQLQKWFQDISPPQLPHLSEWASLWEIIKVISLFVLTLLIIWTGWRLWLRLHPYLKRIGKQLSESVGNDKQIGDKETSVTGWIKKAQYFQQQGNYYQACRCLYLAMLQRLNDTGIIPHQASLTDGEYLYLIQQLPQPEPYETLLLIHQQLCFSNIKATPILWQQCREAYQQIEMLN